MAGITSQKQNLRGTEILRSIPAVEWLNQQRSILFLSGLAIFNGLVYAFGFIPMANLLKLYQLPHLTLYTLPQGGTRGLGQMILAFLALGLAYWQGWRLARNIQGKTAWAIMLGSSLVSGFLLLFLYPFDAADVFDNMMRGRMLGVYGANPFLQTPAQFARDPIFKYVAWKGWTSAYGPGWEVLAGWVARLAGSGVVANILAFKMLPGAFLLAIVGLVALTLRKTAPKSALANTLLLAWNPVVLYETWGNGHNDMAMVFWILAAVLALLHHRHTLAILALVVGGLFKFIPILLIPPALVLAWRDLRFSRWRAGFLAITMILSILLVVLAYSPFWEGTRVLNVKGRTRLYTTSLPSMIYYTLLDQRWSKAKAAATVSRTALGLIGLFVFRKSQKLWKKPDLEEYLEANAQILLFYLLVACLWFQNWYTLWPAGLASLLKPGPTRRLSLLLGFAALVKPLGIGPLLFWPRPRLAEPWLEIWLSLGVLGLPWIYWSLSAWRHRREYVSL